MKWSEVKCRFCYNLDGIETGTDLEDRALKTRDAKIPGTSCGIYKINSGRQTKKKRYMWIRLRTRCPIPKTHAMEANWRPELGSTRALWTCVGLIKCRDMRESVVEKRVIKTI